MRLNLLQKRLHIRKNQESSQTRLATHEVGRTSRKRWFRGHFEVSLVNATQMQIKVLLLRDLRLWRVISSLDSSFQKSVILMETVKNTIFARKFLPLFRRILRWNNLDNFLISTITSLRLCKKIASNFSIGEQLSYSQRKYKTR